MQTACNNFSELTSDDFHKIIKLLEDSRPNMKNGIYVDNNLSVGTIISTDKVLFDFRCDKVFLMNRITFNRVCKFINIDNFILLN